MTIRKKSGKIVCYCRRAAAARRSCVKTRFRNVLLCKTKILKTGGETPPLRDEPLNLLAGRGLAPAVCKKTTANFCPTVVRMFF